MAHTLRSTLFTTACFKGFSSAIPIVITNYLDHGPGSGYPCTNRKTSWQTRPNRHSHSPAAGRCFESHHGAAWLVGRTRWLPPSRCSRRLGRCPRARCTSSSLISHTVGPTANRLRRHRRLRQRRGSRSHPVAQLAWYLAPLLGPGQDNLRVGRHDFKQIILILRFHPIVSAAMRLHGGRYLIKPKQCKLKLCDCKVPTSCRLMTLP
jgi:hypothetical protein